MSNYSFEQRRQTFDRQAARHESRLHHTILGNLQEPIVCVKFASWPLRGALRNVPETGLPGSPGRRKGTLVFVRFAPVPLEDVNQYRAAQNVRRNSLSMTQRYLPHCVTYQDPSQKELASFMSSHIPSNSMPEVLQLRRASVHHSCVFFWNQSGKT